MNANLLPELASSHCGSLVQAIEARNNLCATTSTTQLPSSLRERYNRAV
jgi:hypothetical protein